MGQKIHPFGFRLGVIQNWSSIWYADKDYAELLQKDLQIRKYVKQRLENDPDNPKAEVAKVDIERAGRKTKVHIFTPQPAYAIGQKGDRVEKLRQELEALTGHEVAVNIAEIAAADLCAQLVAERLAQQLERRISFRRAMKKAMQNTMRLGAKGIRIRVAGRLNGAEIARAEQSREGSVPLHTLRANVDYGTAVSRTTYGAIGVKVWIYLGDVMPGERVESMGGAAGARRTDARAARSDDKPGGGRGGGGGGRGGRGGGRGGRGGRGRRADGNGDAGQMTNVDVEA
ncbi:MAG TPA: 30S ribosomal protein S3 [Candidatus Hydrogenedentes bacterium]|nr:30S ribosomal protein S3 [Candidatus Hydrogenedentota bacterium]